MAISDIFARLNAHLIEGMMFHDRMANYFDFLGLMGYKRMHEYHFLRESAEMRGLNRYYLNHYNRLIPDTAVTAPQVIPAVWYDHSRKDVESSTKKTAVEAAIDQWAEWEHESKKLYEKAYCDLCDLGEVAAACKVKDMIQDVDQECKYADRLYILLSGMDYDMPTISDMQVGIHAEYDEKEAKGVCVKLC